MHVVMQGSLQLDSGSKLAAKAACATIAARLAQVNTERQQILSSMRMGDLHTAGQLLASTDLSARSLDLMDKVAALADNAMMHKEIARHVVRVFVRQICSPAMLGTMIAESWPIFPDFHGALYAAAADA